MEELKAMAIVEEAVEAVDEGQSRYHLIDDAIGYVRKYHPTDVIISLWGGLRVLEAYIDAYVSEPEEASLSDEDIAFIRGGK